MDLEDPVCVGRATLLPIALLSQHWEGGITHFISQRRLWKPR